MILGRKPLTALTALLITASLTGCATGPKVNLPTVATGNDRIQIMWLHTYKDKGGVRVLGHVRRAPQTFGAIGGHLHVVAYFTDGTQPVVADTRWGSLPIRGSRMSPFSALLRTSNPDGIDRIAVEYRPNSKDA